MELKESFFLIVHKGHSEQQLRGEIEYREVYDPSLFLIDVNSSDGAQIALELGVIMYPTFLYIKDGVVKHKEWIHISEENDEHESSVHHNED